jgi:hypothetical protein
VQMRNDLWGGDDKNDRVKSELEGFVQGIVRLCRPVVDHEFKPDK